MMADLSKHDCKVLSEKIRNNFYKPLNNYKSTIFLCGAALSDKTTARFKFAEALKKAWYRNQYDIVYPEDIFEELLYSSQSKDLLSLENLLAESVDAIVLIPESVGSIAELGAFANDIKLRGKIICILDEKYKKHKSFINQGPVKLIKKTNKDGVIYINPDNIANEIDKVIASVKKLKKISNKVDNKISLLQLDNFLLPTLFLLDFALKSTLVDIIANVTDEKNAFQATTAALTILTKKKYIEYRSGGYKLTQTGITSFLNSRKLGNRIKTQSETIALDNLRLEILNLNNRQKRLKV